jgi:hypothetical protein
MSCDSSRIRCGGSLCVPKDEACPLTSFNFENGTIAVQRDTDENARPIHDIRAEINHNPCINPYRSHAHPGPYRLFRGYGVEGCGKYGVLNETRVVDSMPIIDFYNSTNLRHITGHLPKFKTFLQNVTLQLHAIPVMRLTNATGHDENVTALSDLRPYLFSLEHSNGFYQMLMAGSVFLLVIYIACFQAEFCDECESLDDPESRPELLLLNSIAILLFIWTVRWLDSLTEHLYRFKGLEKAIDFMITSNSISVPAVIMALQDYVLHASQINSVHERVRTCAICMTICVFVLLIEWGIRGRPLDRIYSMVMEYAKPVPRQRPPNDPLRHVNYSSIPAHEIA